ncbi:caspase-3 [Harpegnathos saltator]|uniref:caspase-3 n=1 Tax=Harpegnathos saltator TaxID=610380 RepID=UPI00058BBA52|nr:caspase-3 [Harpegnathos saltator]
MEQRDREKIDMCCNEVVPKIKMYRLFPKLLEHKVYNQDDVNIPKWTQSLTDPSTSKDIFLKIKTRGPKAFQRLLLCLKQIGQEDIADTLEGKVKQKCNDNISKENISNKNVLLLKEDISFLRECSFYRDIQKSNEPLKIDLHKATEFLDDGGNDIISRYPMRSNPRGLVLLITNIDYNLSKEKPRLSAQHDETNLKELFEQMGFKVIAKRDLTGKDIKEAVKEFSRSSDLVKVDSCFVIISSHGTEDEKHHTEIQGVDSGRGDYEKVLCTEILDYFSVDACPQLSGKPKIFVFQLCRGPRKQNAVSNERLVTDTCAVFPKDVDEELKSDNTILIDKDSMRNYADMLVVYSTLPGHVAYRDSKTGSWFIQILCYVFMILACKIHVRDLFSIIDSELQHLRTGDNNCQTSSVKSIGFNRYCYLNPGYFPDQM